MGQLTLPDWAKSGPAQEFRALDPHEDSLSDGIGQSYPIIGYRGKVWSWRHQGLRKNFIRPDDGTPASYLDVVILGQARQKSKSFYPQFDPNNEGGRPLCSSIDGVVPDLDATQKQAETCALCPRNVWKTDPQTGRKGRECTDYKRIAVLVLPAQTKAIMGEPYNGAAFLRVPPASLQALGMMGDTMAAQGFHYSSYITRITFDPNEAHPKMVFTPLQGLTGAEAQVIMDLRKDQVVSQIVNGVGAASPPTYIQPIQPISPGATPAGVPLRSTMIEGEYTTGDALRGMPVGGSAPAVAVPPATPTSPPTTSGSGLAGLGTGNGEGTGIAPPAPQAIAPLTTPPSADTGAPEAADDELDARIAALIPKKK